ncbi:MAG: hypothetical protein EOM06_07460 [Sphingobacteriia bacterium]|nr:hypothetical protein [Sphingobacteriia bacterium]
MKHTIFIFKVLVFVMLSHTGANALAQRENNKNAGREQIEMIKTRFLTRQMQLTKEEARLFWPVYDQYQKNLIQLRKDRDEWLPGMPGQMDTLTDDQINKLIDARLKNAEDILNARKKLVDDLREVLSPHKIALFLHSERQFNQELQNRVQQRRIEQPPSGRNFPR